MQGSQGEGAGLCLQDMYQNTAYYVYDTLLMVGRGEETWKSMWGQGAPSGDRTGVKACLLLSREDSVATECTRDEELPVLQGQVPFHKHVQGDLVGDQALPAAEQDRDVVNISISIPTTRTSLLPPTYRRISSSRSSGLTVLWSA